MLDTFGLDDTSESVYRAMLAYPHDGVATLRERLNLTDSQLRMSLDRLSELELVRASYEWDNELRAVPPDVGIQVLLARQQAELATQQQRFATSQLAAARLVAEYANLKPSPSASRELIGLDEIRERISALSLELTTEIMTFAPGGAHKAESIEASRPYDQGLLERGIRMRTLYQESVRNSHLTMSYLTWLEELGGEVRTVPELPTRMIIFDRATAIVPVSRGNTGVGAVVLTGEGTLTALCALFENAWEVARPLTALAAPAGKHESLAPQEDAVIRLLSKGLTDEAIARRLGISPRTARRIATDLMGRLGARSRFEFGVRAVQSGWLPEQE
jgi:DNA-binding CsgD family transcriptional regulator/sugar-specific transcriptional regulator TrmB